jgi:excisionase family DNA binding protein
MNSFFSTIQVAKILKISRIAVFKNIKSGKLKAEKAGRNYIIKREDLIEDILRDSLLPNASKEDRAQMLQKIQSFLPPCTDQL